MKLDVFLTKLSIVFGGFGLLSWFLGTMVRWTTQGIPSMSASEWTLDAIVLLAAAIWLKLGAIYHKQ